ncbi:MAG: hypothetical protein AABW67_04740 [Nanoarchaeota archaeon]
MKMLEKLRKAKPYELGLWMLGAGILSFGLGAVFAGYFQNLAWLIVLIGVVIHGWAMYKIYLSNNKKNK